MWFPGSYTPVSYKLQQHFCINFCLPLCKNIERPTDKQAGLSQRIISDNRGLENIITQRTCLRILVNLGSRDFTHIRMHTYIIVAKV